VANVHCSFVRSCREIEAAVTGESLQILDKRLLDDKARSTRSMHNISACRAVFVSTRYVMYECGQCTVVKLVLAWSGWNRWQGASTELRDIPLCV
jgi:hypothetical protein